MLLDEIGKLRAGDFDEELLASTIANYKRGEMQALEENGNRAMAYVDAFINGVDWKRSVEELDRLSKVTKADVVAWANEKLDPEVYAAVYKRQGVDPNIHKIDKPKITPIATNRDKSSEFLAAIQAAEVEAVQPVFVDYASDLSVGKMKQDIEVLYKQNTTNGCSASTTSTISVRRPIPPSASRRTISTCWAPIRSRCRRSSASFTIWPARSASMRAASASM